MGWQSVTNLAGESVEGWLVEDPLDLPNTGRQISVVKGQWIIKQEKEVDGEKVTTYYVEDNLSSAELETIIEADEAAAAEAEAEE